MPSECRVGSVFNFGLIHAQLRPRESDWPKSCQDYFEEDDGAMDSAVSRQKRRNWRFLTRELFNALKGRDGGVLCWSPFKGRNDCYSTGPRLSTTIEYNITVPRRVRLFESKESFLSPSSGTSHLPDGFCLFVSVVKGGKNYAQTPSTKGRICTRFRVTM